MPKLLISDARPARISAAASADDSYGASAEPNWRDTNWREHLHSAEIEGAKINYADVGSGEGPPLVFIHGLSGSWQNWLENLPYFAQQHRCIAMDLPGFGFSDMPREKISISGYARQVDALCEQLGLGECIVIGNSMGGFVGAELAIQFPQRVERLCLAAAAGLSTTQARRRPAMTAARVLAATTATSAAQRRTLVVRPRLRHAVLSFVFRHPTRIAGDLAYETIRGAGKPGFVDALDALMGYDFKERLPQIGCPTLIVWGEDDMVIPVRDAAEFERLVPESRTVIMKDTGHVPMMERPVKFNECLEQLVEQRGLGAETGPEEQVTAA